MNIIKEKYTILPLEMFGYSFNIYYVKNDNTFWYEVIATKDNKEYYVCKLDYKKTYKGIRTFLIKDTSRRLKEKNTSLNIKTFKNSIKINDKLFSLLKPSKENDFNNVYVLEGETYQYIAELKKNKLVA